MDEYTRRANSLHRRTDPNRGQQATNGASGVARGDRERRVLSGVGRCRLHHRQLLARGWGNFVAHGIERQYCKERAQMAAIKTQTAPALDRALSILELL